MLWEKVGRGRLGSRRGSWRIPDPRRCSCAAPGAPRRRLSARHIGDGKLGPGGELQGDNVAGFHALGDKPCGHTPGFVVNLPVGEAASRVVADVFAVGVSGTRSLPDVGDGVVRPIPLVVPTLLKRLVDLQSSIMSAPSAFLTGRYRSPGGHEPCSYYHTNDRVEMVIVRKRAFIGMPY